MSKVVRSVLPAIYAAAFCIVPSAAQPPAASPVPEPTVPPFLVEAADTRPRREQAYAKLFEGQRHMWKLQRMQTQAGRADSRRMAREAFEAAVDLDPTLAEAHAALAQLAVAVPPRDIEEGIRQAELAVKADTLNVGGRRMLARFLTVKSRLNNGPLDPAFAERAQAEWREIARLEPRNAEAWAFLAAFAEARNRSEEQVEALRKWVSAAPPTDVGFYEGTMGGSGLSPESASLKLASALTRSGKLAEAASLLGELISDDPKNSEAVALLSEVGESLETADATSTVAALKQAVFANPDNVSLVDMLARLHDRLGQFDEAVNLLKRHITTMSKNDGRGASTLAVSLAELYLQKDRYDASAATFVNALTIRGVGGTPTVKTEDREFVQYVFEKLIHVGKLANRPQAIKAYIERARKVLGKGDLFADRQMVRFLRRQGSRKEALALVRSLRANRPDDVGLVRLEATLLIDLGQADSAVELVRARSRAKPAAAGGSPGIAAIPVPPSDEFSDLVFISHLYTRAGRGREAIDAANRALSAATGSERRQIAKMTLATAQQINGDAAAAEQTIRDVLKETPGSPMALNNLGYFLTERGEKLEEAVEMIKRALKVDPKNPSYLDSLGWAYFKLGRLNEAEKYLSDAARADADSATVFEHLGDVRREKKDLVKARFFWERALRLSSDSAAINRLRTKLGK